MTLKFQLNIDTSTLTPATLGALLIAMGTDIPVLMEDMAPEGTVPAIERYQCGPAFSNRKAVGNWRIITS